MREVIYNVVRVANVNSVQGQTNGQGAVSKRNRKKSVAGGVGRHLDRTLQVSNFDVPWTSQKQTIGCVNREA